VVLAIGIAVGSRTRAWRDRLGRPSLNPAADLEAVSQLGIRVEVELVTDVSIRQSIVKRQVVDVKRAVRKWIAFIRVVVEILCKDVVAFELKAIAESFPDPDGEPAIE